MEHEKAVIEAILFLEGQPIGLKSLARASGLSSAQVDKVLADVSSDLAQEGRGLEIVSVDGEVQLLPKRALWPRLRNRYGKNRPARSSRAAMETLSIIAYSQPITRGEIESLRGVGADAMIRQLVERGFVREVGRKDAPGRPAQYGTTRDFLVHFGLQSISELPRLDEVEQERFQLNG